MKVIRSAGRPSVGRLYIYRVLHQIHPNTSQIKQVYVSVLFLSVSRGHKHHTEAAQHLVVWDHPRGGAYSGLILVSEGADAS